MTLIAAQERFLSLVEENKKILYKVANAYCKDPNDRPDLLQEIVIQLWQSFNRFDNRCQFSTWMYRIAINVAIWGCLPKSPKSSSEELSFRIGEKVP